MVTQLKYETILLEKKSGTGIITLNRPEVLNAINSQMIIELNAAMDDLESDPDVRSIVIQGKGRAFSSGFDLTEGQDDGQTVKDTVYWRDILVRDFDLIMRFWRSPKPTIAVVQGYALGGGFELALACDLTVAADDCRFGEPELRFSAGIVALLIAWYMSPKQSKEIYFLASTSITAQEAQGYGMINRIVPLGQEREKGLELARELSMMDPQSMQLAKQSLNQAYDAMGMRLGLDTALGQAVQMQMIDTPNYKAFKEKIRTDGVKAAIAWREEKFNRKFGV